jgi:GT2 family glycosyltransferase
VTTTIKENTFLYSICIRTLGNNGNKFEMLLESIDRLSIKPNEVIIVLPRGYSVPQGLRGVERVVYSSKGMLAQRICGYENALNKYVLLLDDDVTFEPETVAKLFSTMSEYDADIVYPINKDLLPAAGMKRFTMAITLQAVPRRDQNVFIHILPTGGYSYIRRSFDQPLPSESCPGMCLLAKQSTLLAINLREDLWVDSSPYAFREDAILSYKAHLYGHRIYSVPGILTKHLQGSSPHDSKRAVYSAYSVGYNSVTFWRKYIFAAKNSALSAAIMVALFSWATASTAILFVVASIRKKTNSLSQRFVMEWLTRSQIAHSAYSP